MLTYIVSEYERFPSTNETYVEVERAKWVFTSLSESRKKFDSLSKEFDSNAGIFHTICGPFRDNEKIVPKDKMIMSNSKTKNEGSLFWTTATLPLPYK